MQHIKEHVSRITSIVQDPERFAEFERPEWTNWRPSIASWRRCFEQHRLDPAATRQNLILTSPELRHRQDMMGRELRFAGDEIDKLFLSVRGSGYSVGLADHRGLIVLERSDHNADHYYPADRPGSLWAEDTGGTNGVGTALIERRPLAVYLSDHFFSDLIHVACIAVPIVDGEDRLLGALNLSIRNPRLSEETHRMIFEVARVSGRRIEEQLFCDRFRGAAILRFAIGDGNAPMLAVGADDRIVGLNRAAHKLLASDPGASFANASLWDYFERKYQRLGPADEHHVELALRRTGTGQVIPARATGSVADGHLRLSVADAARAVGMVVPTAADVATPPAAAPAACAAPTRAQPPSLADCAGGDPRMRAHVHLLHRVRATGLPILLLGETGVGKDTLARAIHAEGDRPFGPFIAVNCAAVPETLIDSELFGYGPGAFTGARKEGNVGRVVAAHGGTLFLDEIGDMPLALQTRLLRVLESGEVAPLGNGKHRHVDIRIIAATNQDLDRRVTEGRFRQDLYFRLAGVVVHLPPLREREDFEALVMSLLRAVVGGHDATIAPETMGLMRAYPWPGNIRELRNVLKRAYRLSDDGIVRPGDLLLPAVPAPISRAKPVHALRAHAAPPSDSVPSQADPRSRGIIARAERDAIEATLVDLGGDIDLCARRLGVSRATLYRKIRAHGLKTGRRN